jgi:hypothetical protein
MGLSTNKQNAQITNACLGIMQLANKYASPVVIENLDFSKKKEQLREQGKKYSRMLSSWAYNKFVTDTGNAITMNNEQLTIGFVAWNPYSDFHCHLSPLGFIMVVSCDLR